MLGKSSKPVIEILTGSSGPVIEPKTQSPRGLKSFDYGGGVGLGIVAALEKSGGKALFGRNLSRSNPIPVQNSSRNGRDSEEIMEMESLEEYTIVTCHGPNKSYTKVYSDGIEGNKKGDDKTPFRIQSSTKNNRASVFHISPARFGEAIGIPAAADFLSSCNLCQKKLDGKDIYMYRGEKAFCSTECRYRQMVVDERTEKCSSGASRTVEVAGSPYANGQILTNGILAI
ncbi:hypothetical protein DH2020_018538 [Rehmannia glutinosa]|uniref:FLZ-type domain-containing protein n=1 Tax=Rehmannia glutinosa TaxID=99300 RepID=A0ABR0WL70_REHGL